MQRVKSCYRRSHAFFASERKQLDGAVELDDCQFHQCVKLGKYDVDRSISFTPPDGEFELMRWVCSHSLSLSLLFSLERLLACLGVRSSTTLSFAHSRYRSTTNVNLPFKIHPIVEEIGKSKVEYNISLRANFDSKLSGNNVVLRIPTPSNTTNVKCQVAMGKAKYVPDENMIIWK